MDPISIYFFALASILGIETTSIVSQKANVTINPVERTFEIHQEDLFSIIMTAEDSLNVVSELRQITEFERDIKKRSADGWIVETIVFHKNGEQLDATLKGRYTGSFPLLVVKTEHIRHVSSISQTPLYHTSAS